MRILMSLLGAVQPLIVAWLGDMDFYVRGPGLALTYVACLLVFAFVYGYPGWKDKM